MGCGRQKGEAFTSCRRTGAGLSAPRVELTLPSHPDVLTGFSISKTKRFDFPARPFTMDRSSLQISTPMRNFVTGMQPTLVAGEHGKAELSGTSYGASVHSRVPHNSVCRHDEACMSAPTPSPRRAAMIRMLILPLAAQRQARAAQASATDGAPRPAAPAAQRRVTARPPTATIYTGGATWSLDEHAAEHCRFSSSIAFWVTREGRISGYLLTSLRTEMRGRLSFDGSIGKNASRVALPLFDLSNQAYGNVTLNFEGVDATHVRAHAAVTLPHLGDMALGVFAEPIDARHLPEHKALMRDKPLTVYGPATRLVADISLAFRPLKHGQGALSGKAYLPSAGAGQTVSLDAHLSPARDCHGLYEASITVKTSDAKGQSRTVVDRAHGRALVLPALDGVTSYLVLLDNDPRHRVFIEGELSVPPASPAAHDHG